jgi:2-C-methyl-D-erythritol 4-phosphate cytidylyltransferase
MSPDTVGAFLKVDGRECVLRSAELFLNRPAITQIQLAVTAEQMEETRHRYGAHLGFSGIKLVAGGPKWADQLQAALSTIAKDATHVIIHDAARPIVAFSDIDALLETAAEKQAVSLSSAVDTPLVELDETGEPVAQHPAGRFKRLLTPQCFSRALFTRLVTERQENHASTWTLVDGSPLNMRVSRPADASLARSFLSLLPKPKKAPLSNPFEEAQW